MKIITKQEKIDNIHYSWTKQYVDWKLDIAKKLNHLNPKTEKGIIDIIGNDTWTSNICEECKTDSEKLIMFGGKYDYEDIFCICLTCLNKGIDILKEGR